MRRKLQAPAHSPLHSSVLLPLPAASVHSPRLPLHRPNLRCQDREQSFAKLGRDDSCGCMQGAECQLGCDAALVLSVCLPYARCLPACPPPALAAVLPHGGLALEAAWCCPLVVRTLTLAPATLDHARPAPQQEAKPSLTSPSLALGSRQCSSPQPRWRPRQRWRPA